MMGRTKKENPKNLQKEVMMTRKKMMIINLTLQTLIPNWRKRLKGSLRVWPVTGSLGRRRKREKNLKRGLKWKPRTKRERKGRKRRR